MTEEPEYGTEGSPWAWWGPIRIFVAGLRLKSGDPIDDEVVARIPFPVDISRNPGDSYNRYRPELKWPKGYYRSLQLPEGLFRDFEEYVILVLDTLDGCRDAIRSLNAAGVKLTLDLPVEAEEVLPLGLSPETMRRLGEYGIGLGLSIYSQNGKTKKDSSEQGAKE